MNIQYALAQLTNELRLCLVTFLEPTPTAIRLDIRSGNLAYGILFFDRKRSSAQRDFRGSAHCPPDIGMGSDRFGPQNRWD